jgi:hypothetical protein
MAGAEQVMLMVSDQPDSREIPFEDVVQHYCKLLGDDPDDTSDWGVPNREINRTYLLAAVYALDQCGFGVRLDRSSDRPPVPDPAQLQLDLDASNVVRLDAWRSRTGR